MSRGELEAAGELTGGVRALGTMFAERKNSVTADLGHLIRKPTKGAGRRKSRVNETCDLWAYQTVKGWVRTCHLCSGMLIHSARMKAFQFPLHFENYAFESISKEHITQRSPLILNPWENQSIYMDLRGKAQARNTNPSLVSWGFLKFLKFWITFLEIFELKEI